MEKLAIDFSKMPCIYWSEVTKMNYVERRIIVHSILYYELSNSVINDGQYDALSRQFVGMKNDYPDDFKLTEYYDVMYDFDGSTGFDLFGRLSEKDKSYLSCIAKSILSGR